MKIRVRLYCIRKSSGINKYISFNVNVIMITWLAMNTSVLKYVRPIFGPSRLYIRRNSVGLGSKKDSGIVTDVRQFGVNRASFSHLIHSGINHCRFVYARAKVGFGLKKWDRWEHWWVPVCRFYIATISNHLILILMTNVNTLHAHCYLMVNNLHVFMMDVVCDNKRKKDRTNLFSFPLI